jgi:hypothetical protein
VKDNSFYVDAIDSLLQMRELIMTQSRDRLMSAKNKRIKKFDNSTHRQSSQFERVKMKTAAEDDISLKMKRAIHRVDSTSAREARSRRRRDRERKIRAERDRTAREDRTARADRTNREDKTNREDRTVEIVKDETIKTNADDIDEIELVRFEINENKNQCE